jgi:hypothetical protein
LPAGFNADAIRSPAVSYAPNACAFDLGGAAFPPGLAAQRKTPELHARLASPVHRFERGRLAVKTQAMEALYAGCNQVGLIL